MNDNTIVTKLSQIKTGIDGIKTAIGINGSSTLDKTVSEIEDASATVASLVSGEIDITGDIEGMMRAIDTGVGGFRKYSEKDYSELEVNKVKSLFETIGGLI